METAPNDLFLLEIPKNKIEQLNKAGINSLQELATYYPRKYEDFRHVVDIADLEQYVGQSVAFAGTITAVIQGVHYVTAQVEDGHGGLTYVTWFNQMHLYRLLRKNDKYVFFGKIYYNFKVQKATMTAPVFYSNNPVDFGKILPIYKKVQGMSYDYLVKCIEKAVSYMIVNHIEDPVPYEARALLGAPSFIRYLTIVHHPQDDDDLNQIRARQVVDALYPFAYKMTAQRLAAVTDSPFIANHDEKLQAFISSLPYKLTDDQRSVLTTLCGKAKAGERINALIQGDVGCGKTVVAIALAVLMAENGYQVAVMAPTTILADQHYHEFANYATPLGIKVVSFASKMSSRTRAKTLSDIANGTAAIVVGTHSILSDECQFKRLGMAIVDEEHRFGVEQRQRLRNKAKFGVHCVSMTATPIPRTLALALYGDSTEVLNIKTMPAGRKPVITVAQKNLEKVFAGLARQVAAGHQCYIVCPMIEDSDSGPMANVESVDTVYDKLKKWLDDNHQNIAVEKATGGLKPETIAQRLKSFADGRTQILISTTIVEVGVNVPNATVMVVVNAERFGLATLHQLRGRVGRGNDQGYCVLLASKMTPRIATMVRTCDGFEISQEDLRLRGSGNMVGEAQHGFELCVTLMLQYPDLYKDFCQYAVRQIESKGEV